MTITEARNANAMIMPVTEREYGVHIDTLNRIIGMNYSIAMHEYDEYANPDLICLIVRGV